MLSVINRGSIVGSEVEGIPYQIVNGYVYNSYQGQPLDLIKLSGVPTPLDLNISPVIKIGYLAKDEPIQTSGMGLYSIPITPVIKSGYTEITVEPTTR